MAKELVPYEIIQRKIYIIRGKKVMIDKDLAELYRVTTGNLNKQVKRNIERFPGDFMFQLKKEEFENLIFQNGRPSYGGRRFLPYVFTEQGVAMLSSVLKSRQAIQVNIAIMRAFARLRKILATHKELAAKLEQLERKVGILDSEVKAVFDAIHKLMVEPEKKPPRQIGFIRD